jgi:hypothetical protein
MNVHRILNATLAVAFVVGTIALAQHLDAADEAWSEHAAVNDARLAAIKERRLQMARIEFCIKSQGPQSYPVEQDGGEFRCVGKRGQKGIQVALQ